MSDTSEITKLLDPIGWHILTEFQEDARIQFVEMGRRVGLSTPAVIERVHRMEDAGIITEYRVEIDHRKVGLWEDRATSLRCGTRASSTKPRAGR